MLAGHVHVPTTLHKCKVFTANSCARQLSVGLVGHISLLTTQQTRVTPNGWQSLNHLHCLTLMSPSLACNDMHQQHCISCEKQTTLNPWGCSLQRPSSRFQCQKLLPHGSDTFQVRVHIHIEGNCARVHLFDERGQVCLHLKTESHASSVSQG